MAITSRCGDVGSDIPITVNGKPLLFERMEGEGQERWEAFCVYRDMGAERSLREVARELQKSLTLIGRWSTEDGWQARVFAYDSWLEAQRREAMRDEAIERGKQHAKALDDVITVLAEPARIVAERVRKGDLNVSEDADPLYLLKVVEQTGRVLPSLIQASRLVNGMSTANLDVHGALRGDVNGKSDDEIERLFFGIDDGTNIAGEIAPPEAD
jgi:hypothetical protein